MSCLNDIGPIMFKFREAFANILPTATGKYNITEFKTVKPFLLESIKYIIIKRKIKNRGPKPKDKTISNVLDALFRMLDCGTKTYDLYEEYLINRTNPGSYYRILHLIMDNNLLEKYHLKLMLEGSIPGIQELDSTHVRSLAGSEGVDYGFKEKGKKAIKLTFKVGYNKFIYGSSISPDNVNDVTAFVEMAKKDPNLNKESIQLYCDSAYNGEEFKKTCFKNGYEIISHPKKKRNGQPTHKLTHYEKLMMRRCRNRIEHVNRQIKSNRGLQIKYNQTISTYNCYLQLGILLVCIHNGIVRGGLRPITKIGLKRKIVSQIVE